jgi:hypothetical protein
MARNASRNEASVKLKITFIACAVTEKGAWEKIKSRRGPASAQPGVTKTAMASDWAWLLSPGLCVPKIQTRA